MIVAIDGELVPPERAVISVLDRGVLYGDGVFEVLRTWRGRMPDLDAHLDRIAAAGRTLALQLPPRERLSAWVRAAVTASSFTGDARVRVVITRGPGGLAARLAALGAGRTIVVVEPLPPQPVELSVAVVDWPLPARRGPGIKALAYLDAIVARELAAAAGADEAVRLDAGGSGRRSARPRTCSSSTPARSRRRRWTPASFPGSCAATRSRCARRLGVACAERPVALAALATADEVFATSSLRGIVAVTRIDGRPIAAGPVAARLAAAYRAGSRQVIVALGAMSKGCSFAARGSCAGDSPRHAQPRVAGVHRARARRIAGRAGGQARGGGVPQARPRGRGDLGVCPRRRSLRPERVPRAGDRDLQARAAAPARPRRDAAQAQHDERGGRREPDPRGDDGRAQRVAARGPQRAGAAPARAHDVGAADAPAPAVVGAADLGAADQEQADRRRPDRGARSGQAAARRSRRPAHSPSSPAST